MSEFITNWLSTTTCQQQCKPVVLLENEDFIVVKHHGHSEYCGRMLGLKYCPTYAALYNKSADKYRVSRGTDFIESWTGRVNVGRIRSECFDKGIIF